MRLFIPFASGLLSLLLALNLSAQIQITQPLNITTDVAERATTQLLTPLPASRAESAVIDETVTEYDLLQLDAELLAELHAEPQSELSLTLPTIGENYQLELRRSFPLANDFQLSYASGRMERQAKVGIHYRGHLAGQPNTHVALSLLDGELQGLLALADGRNLVLGPLTSGRSATDTYILYADDPLFASQDFDCATEDSGVDYRPDQINVSASQRSSSNNCVKVYFEVDYNIYQDKGSNTAAYVAAAFNEVAALYDAINVPLVISEIFVWDQFSPYGGNSSGTLLTQFQSQRPSFNGDIAQLLSYSASGGIAVLSGLCHPVSAARMSFSSIGSTFQAVPTYSWTIMVIAHELGHLLGSQHTHACVWNGNGTAIDGCAGFTEGNCGNPGIPQAGGNVMSYCHLTSAGINFNLGIGGQPGAVIYNFVNTANCATGDNCGSNPPPPPPTADTCANFTAMLELTLDDFGMETTWILENEAQQVLYSGGPYAKKKAGLVIRDTFCLPEACYVLRILDEDGDGICCDYGDGGFQLWGPDNELITANDTFSTELTLDFCLPEGDPPVVTNDCININFNDFAVVPYGQTQDGGTYTISANGNELAIRDNAWKAIELPWELTENTVIEFDFRSTIEGEIHGIGFDDNEGISPDFTFRVHGTQGWGNNTYDNYVGNGQWQHYVIAAGAFMTGQANYLFFCADHDLGQRNGNSFFRNVKVYEGEPCTSNLATPAEHGIQASLAQTQVIPADLLISPNPVADQLQFISPDSGQFQVLNSTGQVLEIGQVAEGRQQISLTALPPGTYLLRFRSKDGRDFNQRFVKL